MLEGRAPQRARGWGLVALVGGVALAVAITLGYGVEQRRKSLRAEVRWLRARLAEKRVQVSRKDRELEALSDAVSGLVGRATGWRERAVEARKLASVDGTHLQETSSLPKPVAFAVDVDGRRATEATARALEQIGWLEGELAAVSDSIAVITALLKQPRVMFHNAGPSLWPVRGLITSGYGVRQSPWGNGRTMHSGIDIQAPYGTPVMATADGEVTFSGRDSEYGGLVIIDHGRDTDTMYAHLSALYVREGQLVRRGTPIGAVGNTGRATGVHLHYEVRVNGAPVDPNGYLKNWTGGATRVASVRGR
jgi:murein DD-endopeptidase MepM/ murein hydrolase activator NlpD